MKAKQALFVGGVFFQVAILSMTFYFLHEMRQEPAFEEEIAAEKGITVPFGHYVLGEGKVLCSKYVKVNARREGIIDDLFVKEGDAIVVGDPLFKVDDGMLRFAFREKLAEYERAVAEMRLFEKGTSEFDLRAKEKEMEQADIRLAREIRECVNATEREWQEAIVQISAVEKKKEGP